jgi:hypothetical protein
MSRTQDAAAKSDRNAALFDNCCKALQKPLECARCQTVTYMFPELSVSTTPQTGWPWDQNLHELNNLLTLLLAALLEILSSSSVEALRNSQYCPSRAAASALESRPP